MSAKVRPRESSRGQSQPNRSGTVSSRWATSRSSSRHGLTGSPSRSSTAIPNTERPRLHPVAEGSKSRLTSTASSTTAPTSSAVHHSQPRDGAEPHTSRATATTPAPNSTSMTKAPARADQVATTPAVTGTSAAGSSIRVSSTVTVTYSPARYCRSCRCRRRVPSAPATDSSTPGPAARHWTSRRGWRPARRSRRPGSASRPRPGYR